MPGVRWTLALTLSESPTWVLSGAVPVTVAVLVYVGASPTARRWEQVYWTDWPTGRLFPIRAGVGPERVPASQCGSLKSRAGEHTSELQSRTWLVCRPPREAE